MANHSTMAVSHLRSGEQASIVASKLWHTYTSTSVAHTSLPRTSAERLASTSSNTLLYLAYGSNLSAETFKGARGIKPLSALNVHVPSLDLTFDLAGIPYVEPCFANTRYRDKSIAHLLSDYHKGRWHKGLVGVVYEVTPEDYRTIIATEGGGASYQDVVVPCYEIPAHTRVIDPNPKGPVFNAHTLLCPTEDEKPGRGEGRIHRPDPGYAQASTRYLKLITDGGEEHELPAEYMTYLYDLQPYTITTNKQKAGQAFMVAFWMPIVVAMLGLSRGLADEDGKIPEWYANIMGLVFRLLWASYDGFMVKAFGDGERTIEGNDDEERLKRRGKRRV